MEHSLTDTAAFNDSNIEFYTRLDLEKFKGFAEMLGLDTGVDIDRLYPYIAQADTVVELGSGYGRALGFILNKGFKGRLIAVERIAVTAAFLAETFKGSVEVLQQDIKNLKLDTHDVDAILWLWSGILELSVEEQLESVRNCSRYLRPGGRLIIEAPYQKLHKVGQMSENKHIYLKTEWGTLHAYLTDMQEVRSYYEACHFSGFEYFTYKTATGIERVFYILTK